MREQHDKSTCFIEEFVTDTQYYGLKNQGATCYLNSILQVLYMTKDFREALKRNSCDSACIDPELAALFENLKKNTAETTEITKKLSIDRVYEQCDAAEYIEKILDLCSKEASKIFQGELTDRTVCDVCDEKTDDVTQFWNLPLALVKTDMENYSVVDAVEKFFQKSSFKELFQLYCDKCCTKCDASSGITITCHPEVLMLLLKRFEFNYTYNTYFKNNCIVDVPGTLNIPENQVYELYAFVEHTGSLQCGHFTATIKSQEEKDDKWIQFNDSNVTVLDKQPFTEANQTLKSRSAYLLFYRKKRVDNQDDSNGPTDSGLPCEPLCNPEPDNDFSSVLLAQDSLSITPNPCCPTNPSTNFPTFCSTVEVMEPLETKPATVDRSRGKPGSGRQSAAEHCCLIFLILFFLLVFLFYLVVFWLIPSQELFSWYHPSGHQNAEFPSPLYSLYNRSQCS